MGWWITCQLCVQLSKTMQQFSSRTKQKGVVCCCLYLSTNARPVSQKILLASLRQEWHRDPKCIRYRWPREEKVGNLAEKQEWMPKQTCVTRRVKAFNPNQACSKLVAMSFSDCIFLQPSRLSGAEALALWGDTEGAGFVQPGEEMA